MSAYPKASADQLAAHVFRKECNSLFGPCLKTYVRGQGRDSEVSIPDSADIREAEYTREFETVNVPRGKSYVYTTELPKIGLVVTVQCNGYGSGQSQSYFIHTTKNHKTKKDLVVGFSASPIYWFTDTVCYFDASSSIDIVQSGNKEGTWKHKSAQSAAHATESFVFGKIALPDLGYSK